MHSKLALITFLDGGPTDPGYGVPGLPGFGGPTDPGFGVRPPVDPGYGRPGFGFGHPDNTLPGGGAHPWFPGHLGGPRPDQGLPGGGHPWLPGHLGGPRPDQGLPGGGYPSGQPVPPPVTPDNTLPETPTTPPPQISLPIYLPPSTKPIEPDALFELKYSVRYGWVIVPVEDEPVAEPKKK